MNDDSLYSVLIEMVAQVRPSYNNSRTYSEIFTTKAESGSIASENITAKAIYIELAILYSQMLTNEGILSYRLVEKQYILQHLKTGDLSNGCQQLRKTHEKISGLLRKSEGDQP